MPGEYTAQQRMLLAVRQAAHVLRNVHGCAQVIAAAGKRMATLPASFAIDMWSLGAIAYEIFTGCVSGCTPHGFRHLPVYTKFPHSHTDRQIRRMTIYL